MSHDSTYSLIADELDDWPTVQAWVRFKSLRKHYKNYIR